MPSITKILHKNSFKDKRVFLLASGPSLKGFDYAPLRKEIVIGTNKSFTTFPDAQYNISLDHTFLDIIYHNPILCAAWEAYRGTKIFVKRKKRETFPKEVYHVEGKAGKKSFISLDVADKIWVGNNSGFTALSFAISCGCKEIYLLGFDLTIGKHGETHNHDGYSHQNSINLENKLWKFHVPFNKVAPLLREMGISIVNLSSRSALRCFPFDNLENILRKSLS